LSWYAPLFILLVQILLIAACAMVAAVIRPFVPDSGSILGTGMMMLMFGSGIFYDYRSILNEEQHQWFLLNPMAMLIEAYRDALIRDIWPDWMGLGWVALGGLAVIVYMLRFFRRNDTTYARLVIQ
jgi:lipopolysaccharide transport system permease protein